MTQKEIFFCAKCGKQLSTVDEIAQAICDECKSSVEEGTEEETFYCKICGKQLQTMDDVSKGICANCKAAIIRKLQ